MARLAGDRSPSRWPARLAVLGFAVLIGAVSLVAMVITRELANPENYDLAATAACLRQSAFVRTIPRRDGLWNFSGLSARFHGEGSGTDVRLYFAPDTDAAKAAEVPDSDPMQRRRNVLTETVASEPWDKRVAGCLRERPSSPR